MLKMIRHCKIWSRRKILSKEPFVRFLCSKCDCVFEVNKEDLKVGKGPESLHLLLLKITNKELIWCEGECPDCHTKVTRCLEVD